MKPSPGVMIEDMGHKIGLNGVDNGRLVFTNVRIPRVAMLNKLNDVNADGKFISDIAKPSNRFFKVADRLLSGRLCIASMCLGGMKKCIYTTIRYSQQRCAAGPTGESDTPIMTYQLQQNALLPLLAKTIVYNCGHILGKRLFANSEGREHEIIKTLCVIKTHMSWHNEEMARICRERCGGGSYTAYSLVSESVWGAHSGMTAEGDNKVLMQKVVKDILAHERHEELEHTKPEAKKAVIDAIFKMNDITSFDCVKTLIYAKEQWEIYNIAKRLQQKVLKEQKKFYDVWMYELNEQIQDTAESYGERYMVESALKIMVEECMHRGAHNLLY